MYLVVKKLFILFLVLFTGCATTIKTHKVLLQMNNNKIFVCDIPTTFRVHSIESEHGILSYVFFDKNNKMMLHVSNESTLNWNNLTDNNTWLYDIMKHENDTLIYSGKTKFIYNSTGVRTSTTRHYLYWQEYIIVDKHTANSHNIQYGYLNVPKKHKKTFDKIISYFATTDSINTIDTGFVQLPFFYK